mmetsp:Transcript_7808/g.9403  ORF Transcript_7808/g.9403 Transcript_7808/m.9403 type:complete len:138 (+) Transcript_7808:75-488(+)
MRNQEMTDTDQLDIEDLIVEDLVREILNVYVDLTHDPCRMTNTGNEAGLTAHGRVHVHALLLILLTQRKNVSERKVRRKRKSIRVNTKRNEKERRRRREGIEVSLLLVADLEADPIRGHSRVDLSFSIYDSLSSLVF